MIKSKVMESKAFYENLIKLLDPKKSGDHDWFLSLLDDEKQKAYESQHVEAVMQMLRFAHIRPRKNAIKAASEEIQRLEKEDGSAENYVKIRGLLAEIEKEKAA